MVALPKADIVLQNGPVYLGLKEGYATAVALWAGKVLATGTPAEMEPLIGPGTKVIDLAGRTATPGLYEAHLHLLPLGLTMKELDIRPRFVRTLDGLLRDDRRPPRRRPSPASGSWRAATIISNST